MSSPSGQLISSGKQRILECHSKISEEDSVLLLFCFFLLDKAENNSTKCVDFRKIIIIVLMQKKTV